jgi:hypothetical protein
MDSFIQRFGQSILGVVHGLDRLRLRGTKRLLANVGGMFNFLWQEKVLLKDFRAYANGVTAEVRKAAEEVATSQGRPVEYLASSGARKEDLITSWAKRDDIQEGLIGVLKAVELCWSVSVHRNRARKKLELQGGSRKCLHYYHYFQDPEVGLVYVRLQTWFPFTVHVGLNGREWLARQMDQAGIRYQRRDNCFVWIADWQRAQELLQEQLSMNWPKLLDRLTAQANPALQRVLAKHPVPYYWSAEESEWASDIAFASRQALAELAPRFYQHGLLHRGSEDTMRFLGRKVPAQGGMHGNFAGEVVADLKHRPEGMRLKHRLNRNWIKMYDKQGSVLRVETVINDARDMKAFRAKEGDDSGELHLQRLRKGIADLHARTELSQAANERYLESLATIEDKTPLGELVAPVCRRVRWHGRPARALNPLATEDAQLLAAVNRGEFAINGFRNRDLRCLLYTTTDDARQQRRQSAAITRKLRLLRAHGLLRKIPKTHRYQISAQGQETIVALLAARAANTATLSKAA